MNLRENIKLALRAIRSTLMRTILTIIIIALGITAMVGILTSIDGIRAAIDQNFVSMGANSFNITNRSMMVRGDDEGDQAYERITYDQARAFREQFGFPSVVSISTRASFVSTLRYKAESTNPNVTVFGSDEHYLRVSGNQLERGRNFSGNELQVASNVVILGLDVKEKLFGKKAKAVEKSLFIGKVKYQVIGVLKSRGLSMRSSDNIVVIPLKNAQRHFNLNQRSYMISVAVEDPQNLNPAVGEATGLFRNIRKLAWADRENFDLTKSDSLLNIFISQTKAITIATILIGLITLFGAAIGLMNIMLVSVTERTREIGISKAIGANNQMVRRQFLIEAVVICQLGGIVGILLGLGIGNLVALAIGNVFIIPWKWMLLGLSLCFGVGLLSGWYPAWKASKLNPINALRYE